MKEFLAITKALSDEGRVRILLALRGGELCVCQLIELLALAPSTVSRHMAILRQAGLVELRKEGRWAYYRLAGEEAPPMVRRALDWVVESVGRNARAQEDRRRLKEILRIDKEELCKLLKEG
ncbi:MAG TPA: ArsR family transcriptional regulator [Nitrospirae bacterium]|nr:ArsR family transcriptional regulator [Nitrospirota bacterium]